MPTREELREGAIKDLMEYKGFHRAPTELIIDRVFKYLNENGGVIKVDGKLPLVSSDYKLSQHGVYVSVGNKALNEQGYVATIPLIKDKK